jgi:hypothetical protein
VGEHRALGTPVVPPVYCRKAMSSGSDLHLRQRLAAADARAHRGSGSRRDVVVRHHLLDVRSTKLTIAPLGKPSMSPRPVVITCLTAFAITSCTVWPKLSSTTSTLAPGVDQLVLEFAGGVHRIDVDDAQAGAQRAEYRDRVLQAVGHHDRDAIAFLRPSSPTR